ncbi:MAG: type 1 glutamine amidotransferase [Bacteroidales bacterium]|nr:type 1 glutamine amidotransferase [Bacteroidales bacterium]
MVINILICDSFPGLLPPGIPSYEWMFMQKFDGSAHLMELQLEYKLFNAHLGQLPQKLRADELYVITGSNSSANERQPWILNLLEWIRRADMEKTKLVGICFGHQAIAQALGGSVGPNPQGWGAGIRMAQVLDTRSEPKLKHYFKNSIMHLVYNHHEQVVELPPQAKRMATSEFCANEGFFIGNHIITFQGHPEFPTFYMEHLLRNHSASEPEMVVYEALNSLATQPNQGNLVMRYILEFAFNAKIRVRPQPPVEPLNPRRRFASKYGYKFKRHNYRYLKKSNPKTT